MAARALLVHQKAVADALQKLSAPYAFTFAVACTERQWPIYERAAPGKPWDQRMVLRAGLDAVWDWLLGRIDRPKRAAECEQAVFDDNSEHEEDNGAFYVANNIFGLAAMVESDERHYSAQAANGGLALIDSFLYDELGLETCPASDRIVDSHELMRREMKHQVDDLRLLQQPFAAALVEEVRRRSAGRSILGDQWYSQ